jgi:hypothetical protein
MPIVERRPPTKPSVKTPARRENVLFLIIALAFLAFNITVGVMVHNALPNVPVAQLEQARASYGD